MFKKFFQKKEKPVREYNVFEIGEKGIYARYFTYIPTKIVYYADRIVFTINAIETPNGGVSTDMEEITVTANLTGERYIPLVINGKDFLWDTEEMLFRRKIMPEGEATELAPPVHIYPNEVLTIKRDFAEKYLSVMALSYSLLQDEDHYIWYYPDGSSSAAVFEIPTVFKAFMDADKHTLCPHPVELINHVGVYNPSYPEVMGIEPDDYPEVYSKNYRREISFD